VTLAAIAVVAGLLIGLSLGALGGGGSILAVPVLVYALDQTPLQATTGSLVVVGVSSVIGAVTAHRAGNLLLGRGISFGLVAVAGAVVGAKASAHVDEAVLLAAFALLMLLVAVLMVQRLVRGRNEQSAEPPTLDDPIITFSPTFICRCPRALKVLVTATAVGLLTGFLGVGGGFLVVPALVLALGLSMRHAPGTSLIVMAITSTAALGVRAGTGLQPDWGLVLLLTAASSVGVLVGARLAARIDTRRLTQAFTGLVLAVAVATASQALPALV